MVDGKKVVIAGSYHLVESRPQGVVALLTAPIKGFVEASLIIGFVLIVGGAFAVLQKTEASIVRLDKMEELFMRAVMLGETDPVDEAQDFYQ